MEFTKREIDRIENEIKDLDPYDAAYGVRLERIKSLLAIEALVLINNAKKSRLQLVLDNAPLLQLLSSVSIAGMVLYHEKTGTILSKAWTFVRLK